MRVIITTTDKILSRLIRWGTNEPASHIVFVFDEKFAIHSYMNGIRLDWYKTIKEHNKIVDEFEIELSLEEEEEIYRSIMDNFDAQKYDWIAILFWGWRVLLNRIFKIPMPDENHWASPKADICTEVARYLPDWIVPKEEIKDFAMISPYRLFVIMRDNSEEIDDGEAEETSS